MKRKTSSGRIHRTTVVFSEALDANLDLLALALNESKGRLIEQAILAFLESKGINGQESPKVDISKGAIKVSWAKKDT